MKKYYFILLCFLLIGCISLKSSDNSLNIQHPPGYSLSDYAAEQIRPGNSKGEIVNYHIKEIFKEPLNNFWYWTVALFLTLLIRFILSLFKAKAIINGEIDDDNKSEKEQFKWIGKSFLKALKYSLGSYSKDIRIDDYWLPAFIGYVELVLFPIFMANSWFAAIGAWIIIKTASSWGGWQKTRTAYNRFLLGNILSLSASFLIYVVFLK